MSKSDGAASIATQTLIVVGVPYACDKEGCTLPAAIVLREAGSDDETGLGGVCGIAYCDRHWMAVRAAFIPLQSFTPEDMVREAERIAKQQQGDEGSAA